jgi:predicted phage tail component-like protein
LIGSFTFNGTHSSTFGLVCKSVKRPLLPAAKIGRIEYTKASGFVDYNDTEYEARTITVEVAYIGTKSPGGAWDSDYKEMRQRARDIANWLVITQTTSTAKLIFDDEDDKYYNAKVINELDLQSLWQSGTIQIVFDCQPFAYSVEKQTITATMTSRLLQLPITPDTGKIFGTRHIDYKSPKDSLFRIIFSGNLTSVNFNMNGDAFYYSELNATDSDLVINNTAMTVEDLLNINKFQYISGSIGTFFKFASLALADSQILEVINENATEDTPFQVTVEWIPMWY